MNHRQKIEQIGAALRIAFPTVVIAGEINEDPSPSWMEIAVSGKQVTVRYHEGDGFSVLEGKTRDASQHPLFQSFDHVLVLARLLKYFTPKP